MPCPYGGVFYPFTSPGEGYGGGGETVCWSESRGERR